MNQHLPEAPEKRQAVVDHWIRAVVRRNARARAAAFPAGTPRMVPGERKTP